MKLIINKDEALQLRDMVVAVEKVAGVDEESNLSGPLTDRINEVYAQSNKGMQMWGGQFKMYNIDGELTVEIDPEVIQLLNTKMAIPIIRKVVRSYSGTLGQKPKLKLLKKLAFADNLSEFITDMSMFVKMLWIPLRKKFNTDDMCPYIPLKDGKKVSSQPVKKSDGKYFDSLKLMVATWAIMEENDKDFTEGDELMIIDNIIKATSAANSNFEEADAQLYYDTLITELEKVSKLKRSSLLKKFSYIKKGFENCKGFSLGNVFADSDQSKEIQDLFYSEAYKKKLKELEEASTKVREFHREAEEVSENALRLNTTFNKSKSAEERRKIFNEVTVADERLRAIISELSKIDKKIFEEIGLSYGEDISKRAMGVTNILNIMKASLPLSDVKEEKTQSSEKAGTPAQIEPGDKEEKKEEKVEDAKEPLTDKEIVKVLNDADDTIKSAKKALKTTEKKAPAKKTTTTKAKKEETTSNK